MYHMYAHAQRISEITKIKIKIPIELNWFSACQEFPTIMKCLVVCVCVCVTRAMSVCLVCNGN